MIRSLRTSLSILSCLLSVVAWSQCEPTQVLTSNADSLVVVCPGDGQSDLVEFSSSETGVASFDFILTDGSGEVITILPVPAIDFDGFPTGRCRVYGVSYDGDLTAPPGEDISQISSSGSCAVLSDNFVEIIKEIPVAGLITERQGLDIYDICAGDGLTDTLYLMTADPTRGIVEYLHMRGDVILDIYDTDRIEADEFSMGLTTIRTLAYSGELTIAPGDTIGLDTFMLSTDCFSLSPNALQISTTRVSAGVITDDRGRSPIYACIANDVADDFRLVSSDSLATMRYVITNLDSIVTEILPADSISLDDRPAGKCLLWGIDVTTGLSIDVGDHVMDAPSVSCADVSDQALEVIKGQPVAPVMRDGLGRAISEACPGDGSPDLVEFQSIVEQNGFLQIIITTLDGLIIGLPSRQSADFERLGAGECRVYGLSYTGEHLLRIGTFLDPDAVLSTDCYELSENFVRVIRTRLDGGTVFSQPDSAVQVFSCPQDGDADLIDLASTTESDASYSYILVRDQVYIGQLEELGSDLDTLSPGDCRIYGVSHIGSLTIQPGDTILSMDGQLIAPIAVVCSELSDNHIAVRKESVDGGRLSSSLGDDTAFLCTESGGIPFVVFDTDSASSGPYALLLLDPDDRVVAISDALIIDIREIPPGDCRVRGVSYTGALLTAPGDLIDDSSVLSSGCYDLSRNEVRIQKGTAEGGEVFFSDSSEVFTACNGDGRPDLTGFINTGGSNLNYAYLLADNNLKFLNVISTDSVDFDLFPRGQCLIVGVSYSGNLIISLGDDIFDTEVSDDCFDLSDNFIVATREGFGEFTLTTTAGDTAAYVCPGVPGATEVSFLIDNPDGSETLLLTDETGLITAMADDGVLLLDPALPGKCYAQSLYYNGALRAEVGMLLDTIEDLSSRCFALSTNRVPIFKEAPEISTVTAEDGKDVVIICPGDGRPNFLNIVSSEPILADFASIITTTDGIVLNVSARDSFDLDAFPVGTCQIYGLVYTGDITVTVGSQIADYTTYSTDCSDLSDNAVVVIKEVPEAGVILLGEGETSTEICVDDGASDLLSFSSSLSVGSQYAYVFTDTDDVVTAVSLVSDVDLDNANAGDCRVYGLAYTGELILSIGDDLRSGSEYSTDCSSLTENFVAIQKTSTRPSRISATVGDSVFYSCVTGSDTLFLDIEGGDGPSSAVVIVDIAGRIIDIIEGTGPIVFTDLAADRYRVHQLYYSGNLSIEVNDILDPTADLSELCHSLSENSIDLIRAEADGGSLSYEGVTDTAAICSVTDALIRLDLGDASPLSYALVFTNASGRVLAVYDGRTDIPSESLGHGVYGITGVSYSGRLLVRPGDNIIGAQIATGCADRATERIWLDLSVPRTSAPLLGGADSVRLCTPAATDTLRLEIDYQTDLTLSLLLVDASGTVRGIVDRDYLLGSDLEGADQWSIYSVSHRDALTISVGEPLVALDTEASCAVRSLEPLSLGVASIQAGNISLLDGGDDVTICVADDDVDLVRFTTTSTSTGPYSYIVTDTDGVIRGFSFGSSFLFNDDEAGECRVYGIAHDINVISVTIGSLLSENDFGTDCLELTDNFVTVRKVRSGTACTNSVRNTAELSNDLSVYPNPGSGMITITWPYAEIISEYMIYDQTRKAVTRGTLPSQRSSVDLSDLQPGIYYLRVTNALGTGIKKLVRE